MVAVQVVFTLVPLLCVAAFAIDGGLLMDAHQRVQVAADASALAAAADLYQNYPTNSGKDTGGTALASAVDSAIANGFTSSNSTITVNMPPTTGSFIGKDGFVEVVIQFNQARGFSAVMGSGTIPVAARAVARGLWTTFGNGIIVLAPTGNGTLIDSGSGSVTVNGGNIVVDSNGVDAAEVTGSGSIKAAAFVITGVPGDLTTGSGRFIGGINSGATPTVDPLNYLNAPPSPTPTNSRFSLNGSSSVTINPGVYVGGISVSGSGSLTLNPGIYIMQGGGFSVSGSGSVTGNGVMLYNAPQTLSDTINLTGSGSVTLTPPSSGSYRGITIFQDRTATAPVNIRGSGSMNITGTLYAPHATMNIQGSGGVGPIGSQYISYNLNVSGSGNLVVSWNSTGTSRTRTIGLVE